MSASTANAAHAYVVYESLWGNTEAVARAVAEGLGSARSGGVSLTDVEHAAHDVPDDVDLVVIGGPTHAFSMTRPNTRESAVKQGAPASRASSGIREWVEDASGPAKVSVATFDTRVATARHFPGSAARSAAKSVRKHHLGRVVDTCSFYVENVDGPLLDGELQRARAWGADLAARVDS